MKTHFAVFVLLATCFLGFAAPAWSIEARPDALVDKTAQEVLGHARTVRSNHRSSSATRSTRVVHMSKSMQLPTPGQLGESGNLTVNYGPDGSTTP